MSEGTFNNGFSLGWTLNASMQSGVVHGPPQRIKEAGRTGAIRGADLYRTDWRGMGWPHPGPSMCFRAQLLRKMKIQAEGALPAQTLQKPQSL